MTETFSNHLEVAEIAPTVSRSPHRSSTLMQRRLKERREIRLYYILGFALCLPVVAFGRLVDGVRGKEGLRQQTVFSETNAKVSAMLGFVYMA